MRFCCFLLRVFGDPVPNLDSPPTKTPLLYGLPTRTRPPRGISPSTLCVPRSSLMATEEGQNGAPGEGLGGVRRRRNRPQQSRMMSAGAGKRGSLAAALSGVCGGGWRIGLLVGLLAASVRRVEVCLQRSCLAEPVFDPHPYLNSPPPAPNINDTIGMFGHRQPSRTEGTPQFLCWFPSGGSQCAHPETCAAASAQVEATIPCSGCYTRCLLLAA